MTFVKGVSGNPSGRKANALNRSLSKRLENLALKQFEAALEAGEAWAIKEVLKRKFPILKAEYATESVGHRVEKQKYVAAMQKIERDRFKF